MGDRSTAEPVYEVEDFLVIGRTFEEYLAMFDLEATDLEGESILDCPSGCASFVAEATARGIDATGVDVCYRLPPSTLAARSRADVAGADEQLGEKRAHFDWSYYGSVADRVVRLERASETFVADYPAGRLDGRYLYAELPTLPSPANAFSLVLSSHLLFLYGDRLDYRFHLASLRELARVASDEVRVYPLVCLDGETYPHLERLLEDLADGPDDAASACQHHLLETPFEFLPGATRQLVLEC